MGGGPFGGMGGGPFGGMGSGPYSGMPNGTPFDPYNLSQLWNQFTSTHPSNPNNTTTPNATEPSDHSPPADIFDTPSSYILHLSLPGAKKEDVGVHYDAEKSLLCIAGVIYRPGDEEFLKTLAVGERQVGAFERKIRLGEGGSSASVDAEGISAKLEDGVLRVEVPKLEGGFVEVRRVDVE